MNDGGFIPSLEDTASKYFDITSRKKVRYNYRNIYRWRFLTNTTSIKSMPLK